MCTSARLPRGALVLEVRELHAGYAGSEVLHGVDLQVADGEGVVVLGPNGHGKTTLLRVLSGLIRPHRGSVVFDGQDITGWRPDLIAAAGLVHIPQGDLLFPEMTVLENLLMGAYDRRVWKDRKQRLSQVFELFPWLTERRDQLARSLSGGERRMLAIGRGLMSSAKLLLIDEPSLGLAPAITERIYASISSVKGSGLSILLADENANHVADLADRAYLLEMGLLVRECSTAELFQDEALLATYLG
jgi:branched-chain amino acid transport system ATP-binding protein